MNRRDLFRTTFVATIGAAVLAPPAAALEYPPHQDASKDLERSDWTPVLMDEHQNQMLIAISDLMIPATDTPGAKAALVNRFLDLLMSAETAETQRAFFAALSYIDGASMEQFNAAFVYLSSDQQTELLEQLAYPHTHARWGEQESEFTGNAHFEKLKNWIVGAYYSSPVGLKELGWDGSFPHGAFSGCEHSDHEHAEHSTQD